MEHGHMKLQFLIGCLLIKESGYMISSSWRSKWGGTIYMNNGSHGCINLPTGIASQLYNSIEVNCPVVCYY